MQAFQAAADQGIKVRAQWLSARDDGVRESHQGADGLVIEMGGNFVLESGASGPAPGSIGEAAEDINCRCTVIALTGDKGPM